MCPGTLLRHATYAYAFLPVGLEGSAEVVRIDVIDDTGDRFATHGLVLE